MSELVYVNVTSLSDPFHSKLHKHVDHILGIYMVTIASLSVVLNGLVLMTMCLRERSFTPLDIYIFNLALCDFCHGLIAHPLMATSSFLHRWPLGDTACHMYSALVFLLGTNDITILTAVCVTRLIKVCYVEQAHYISNRSVLVSLVPIYSNGLLWSVAPLLGWGRYAVEPFGLSCTLDWPVIPWTYTVSIFAFCYVLPMVLLLVCYGKIVHHVHKASASLVSSKLDFHVAKMATVMCVCFFLAWTPYTIVSFLYLCHASHSVPHFAAVAAPFFAKSSTLYNPLVYFLAVKRFRADTKRLLCQFTNNTRLLFLANTTFSSGDHSQNTKHLVKSEPKPKPKPKQKTEVTEKSCGSRGYLNKTHIIINHKVKDSEESYELKVLRLSETGYDSFSGQ